MKIPNKRELQKTVSSHLSQIDFIKLYKEYIKEPHSFLVNGITLSSDNPPRFRKDLQSEY